MPTYTTSNGLPRHSAKSLRLAAAGSFELQSRGPIQAASGNTKLADLVAGTVPSGINRGEGFDPVSPGPFPRQTLQLYSNSAERMEAATRVEVGQILDTTA